MHFPSIVCKSNAEHLSLLCDDPLSFQAFEKASSSDRVTEIAVFEIIYIKNGVKCICNDIETTINILLGQDS